MQIPFKIIPGQNQISIRGQIVPPTECLLDTYKYIHVRIFHFEKISFYILKNQTFKFFWRKI